MSHVHLIAHLAYELAMNVEQATHFFLWGIIYFVPKYKNALVSLVNTHFI